MELTVYRETGQSRAVHSAIVERTCTGPAGEAVLSLAADPF